MLHFVAVGCSHQRAWEYFVESIRQPLAFPVERCEPSQHFGSCRDGNGRAYMGYGADPRWAIDINYGAQLTISTLTDCAAISIWRRTMPSHSDGWVSHRRRRRRLCLSCPSPTKCQMPPGSLHNCINSNNNDDSNSNRNWNSSWRMITICWATTSHWRDKMLNVPPVSINMRFVWGRVICSLGRNSWTVSSCLHVRSSLVYLSRCKMSCDLSDKYC